MIWLGVATGVVMVAALTAIAVKRRRDFSDGWTADEVAPTFTFGMILTGAGVALATTLGGAMYGLMIVGLITMAIGANQMRNRDN